MGGTRIGAVAACACLAACGGGSGSGSSNGGGLFGDLRLVGHEPGNDAVQVPVGAALVLRFDAPVVLDSLRDEDTRLVPADGASTVAGDYRLTDAGRTVVFTPTAPLAAETDYVFRLSPLTCDQGGRILEQEVEFRFRTTDATPPAVAGANVAPGETGRSRTGPLVVTFSEPIDPASVTPGAVVLRDAFGVRDCRLDVAGTELTVSPLADLPGDRAFTLQVAATLADRAGNELGSPWSRSFRTAADLEPPVVVDVWPPDASTGVSPQVEPAVRFSEAMDPLTVEPASLAFQDEFGSLVPFTVLASPDQRTLRVHPAAPLIAHRTYFLAFLVSGAAVTDVSGNALRSSQALSFTTGDDDAAPTVVGQQPAANASRVGIGALPTVTFDEPLDPRWVGAATVSLLRDGEPVACVVDLLGGATVRVTPVEPLAPSCTYRLTLRGGWAGLRDLAGNVLAMDHGTAFTTTADGAVPAAFLQPPDGAADVPTTARVSIVFDQPLDPETVSAGTCELRDGTGTPVPADVALAAGDRVVTITPWAPLLAGAAYDTFVRGGPDGVLGVSGNWLGDDLTARFRTGSVQDTSPPLVTATVNGIDPQRRTGIVLPPCGFTIDVAASDPNLSLDIGTVEVELSGPEPGPLPADLFRGAVVGHTTFQTNVPPGAALTPGPWTLRVRVADLSGNVGSSAPCTFAVVDPGPDLLPFERTQVVWVRTDLDRDGSGRPDFDDDLLRLGLATAGDPARTDARIRALLLDAILARANGLYGRGPRGEPLGPDAVPLRLIAHRPAGLPHMEIALGGLDPEGNRLRTFGAASTGVLGRAFYDHRNSQVDDRNIGTSPGLGVFPAEMWLYQANLHLQVFPSFQTLFARTFLPLCPDMGGTPVGSDPLDAVVLAPGFDPAGATTQQRARWTTILRAIDDWAAVVGTILAHETGHAVGLVAPGPAPGGLFGDGTLHDTNSGATEVMAPAVGYEAMVSLPYAFRDTDLAYLRQRIVLR